MPEERAPSSSPRRESRRRQPLPPISRESLPEKLTPETIREIPLSVLGRLAKPNNGVLSPEEQSDFDSALHQMMSETAGRLSKQIGRSDLARVRREAMERSGRAAGGRRPAWMDDQLRRVAQRIDDQLGAAEALAPGVDWSFAQSKEDKPAVAASDAPSVDSSPPDDSSGDDSSQDDDTTVSDLENDVSQQVELVQVMSEIAEVGKRTYVLEKQRDRQETRTVFFGFVVSVAVLVAGYAPLVAADDWAERWWILGLTLVTCVVAGLVYALIRQWQTRHPSDAEEYESE